jgi:hypothetical protein
VYASLGDDALVHALGETEVKTVVADLKLMGKLAKVADKLTTIERVIYFDDINPDSEIFTLFNCQSALVIALSKVPNLAYFLHVSRAWLHKQRL